MVLSAGGPAGGEPTIPMQNMRGANTPCVRVKVAENKEPQKGQDACASELPLLVGKKAAKNIVPTLTMKTRQITDKTIASLEPSRELKSKSTRVS